MRYIYFCFLLFWLTRLASADPLPDSTRQHLNRLSTDAARIAWLTQKTNYWLDKGQSHLAQPLVEAAEHLVSGNPQTPSYHIVRVQRAQLLFLQGHYDASVGHYRTVWQWVLPNGTQDSLAAHCARGMANAFTQQGALDSAFHYYAQASARFGRLGFAGEEAGVYNNLGITYQRIGKLDTALTYFQQALRTFAVAGQEDRRAIVLNNIGELYREDFRDLEKALSHYREAVDINRQRNNTRELASNYNNIANVYQAQGQPREAIQYLHQALALQERADNAGFLAKIHYNLGTNYLDLEDAAEAVAHFTKTIRIGEEIGFQMATFHGYLGLSKGYAQLERYASAQKALYQVLGLARALRVASSQEAAYAHAYRLYRQTSQPDSALHYFERLTALRDSLSQATNQQHLAELRTAYETERAERENQVLRLQAIEQEASLQQQQLRMMLLGAVCLLVLGTAFVLYGLNRQKQKANRLLRQQGDTIATKNEALEQLHAQVSEQNAALAETIRTKDRLFMLISHDLRSPLGSLQGLLTLFNAQAISEADRRQMGHTLETRLQHTLQFLDDLLLWARSQRDGLAPSPKRFPVRELFEDARQLLQTAADEKTVVLHNEAELDQEAFADEDMVLAVVRNLLHNAIKFCRPGDRVALRATSDGTHLHLGICDTGVGIEPTRLTTLFDYGHSSTQGTASEKGTGLGLSLCRDFVEQQGGRIWAESQPGAGTCFWFTLPLPSRAQTLPPRVAPFPVVIG